MKSLKSNTFLLFFSLIFFKNLLLCEPVKIDEFYNNTQLKDATSEKNNTNNTNKTCELTNSSNSTENHDKKTKTSVKFIYDENGYFFCDQIFPFIKEQRAILNLRLIDKSLDKAFCEFSKKYKPIIKQVKQEEISTLIEYLETNKKNINFNFVIHVTSLYNQDCNIYIRTVNDDKHQEQIKSLRAMGIKVLDEHGKDYPEHLNIEKDIFMRDRISNYGLHRHMKF